MLALSDGECGRLRPGAGCASDLLFSGRCPNCDRALTSLLVPTRCAELVDSEYLALFGAVSVLAGLALATSAERAS